MAAPDPSWDIEGRVAVVTGAGGGIGRAIARALAAAGARVAVIDRDGVAAQAVAEQCGGLAVTCDVSDPAAVGAAGQAVLDACGPAGILVNNAGMIRAGGLADLADEDWNAVLSVNLTGYFLCARTFGAQMRGAGGGAIVHVSSVAAEHATPNAGAYSVAKAGVSMLSRQLAIEWGGDGIRSNCVCPGMIHTPLSRDMYARPGIEAARAATIPGGRICAPKVRAHRK